MPLSPRTLRPANNFTPRSVAGLALWLDASDASTLFQDAAATTPATATSDPVGAWLDKSGNARHLTQATSASRPTFLPTGISSKPALNFDGTDDNIWRQPGLTSDDLSILMVHQTNFMSGGVTYELTHQGDTTNSQSVTATGFQNVAGLQVSATGSPTYMSDVQRSFANVDIQGRSGTAGDITANVPALSTQCVSYSASTSAIRKQAWTGGKGMLNTVRFNCGGWSAITLGARRNTLSAGGINSPTVFLSGRIAEAIAYSRYITDTERRRLELYLARKWSITLTGAPTVSNAEAQDWIDRVYGNGGSVSSTTAAAVNTLCQSITDAGIRDRFYRLNVFAGSNLNAALTPLYLGPTPLGIRYGNTTDTNVGPFVSGDYAESNGLDGDGIGKYLNTGMSPDNMGVPQTVHLAAFKGGGTWSASREFMGSRDADDFYTMQCRYPASTIPSMSVLIGGSVSTINETPISTSASFLIGTRNSASELYLWQNGTKIATGSVNATTAGANPNPYMVFTRNVSGTAAASPWEHAMRAYSIGLGLHDAQAVAYNIAMQAFQAALGRAT
jgi:hypothetical protein